MVYGCNVAPSGSKCIPYLTPDTILNVSFHDKKPITIKVPEKVKCKVVESGLPQSGSTDGAIFKTVVLDNGCSLTVPEFIQVDDTIIVNIHTLQYHSRVQ
jgi:elongation factor P